MWDDDELIEIINSCRAVADEALAAIQQDVAVVLNLAAFETAAGVQRSLGLLSADPADLCVRELRARDLLDAFAEALRARGVELDSTAVGSDRVNVEGMEHFLERAKTFRCRIEVDDKFSGSGCLVGPGLVLTAWHVVRRDGPGITENPQPRLTVTLADGNKHEAAIPPYYESPCGDEEWNSIAPSQDADVLDRHDVALLTLRRPAARHLGFVRMPTTAPRATSRAQLWLLDFPAGVDKGLGNGKTWKIPHVTVRLRHDVATEGGSSGGACFNERFEFFGLHQGKYRSGRVDRSGRFVPASLFLADLAVLIAKDISPTELWHLDGQSDQLVIGRDLFVRSIAEASKETTRVRGIRVKRTTLVDGDETGLGFSYRILDELLHRQGGERLAVRVPVGDTVPDLMADVLERVDALGLPVPEPPSPGGVDPVQAAPEAAARDRAARLAAAVNQAAAKLGRTVWFFFEGPSVRMTDTTRLYLEGFVAACLTLPRIRVVVAGLETVQLAGLEFAGPEAAIGEGPTGLVVDFIGEFIRGDVLDCLARAATELTGEVNRAVLESQGDLALQGLRAVNGRYPNPDLGTVVGKLQNYLALLREQGGTDND
ncbi:trypsin-like serine peptidase [Kribbella sp. CA-245084]|uniref:trypsin-like serine peptidase n=1 Tax=Kribbella sp. CA-245084 TaxID=3239940 RepID=UPI003D8C6C2B